MYLILKFVQYVLVHKGILSLIFIMDAFSVIYLHTYKSVFRQRQKLTKLKFITNYNLHTCICYVGTSDEVSIRLSTSFLKLLSINTTVIGFYFKT